MEFGWIKLHRKLRQNPLFIGKPAYLSVWIEILFEAEHGMKNVGGKWVRKEVTEMKQILWRGKQTFLKPGQMTLGRKQLSKWSGVPEGTVQRILYAFKNEQMIEHQRSSKFSLITVLNWEAYQINEHHNEHQVNISRTSGEHTLRTLRTSKNVESVPISPDELFKTAYSP